MATLERIRSGKAAPKRLLNLCTNPAMSPACRDPRRIPHRRAAGGRRPAGRVVRLPASARGSTVAVRVAGELAPALRSKLLGPGVQADRTLKRVLTPGSKVRSRRCRNRNSRKIILRTWLTIVARRPAGRAARAGVHGPGGGVGPRVRGRRLTRSGRTGNRRPDRARTGRASGHGQRPDLPAGERRRVGVRCEARASHRCRGAGRADRLAAGAAPEIRDDFQPPPR